ncbi:MAG: type II toxin-antitoxin system VapC family toxin [Acidobacteriota bacterium]
MIVVDASAMIEVLLITSAGLRLEKRVFADGMSLHAPQLLDLEIAQVLRRFTAAGCLTGERARQALDDLTVLGIQRWPHEPLLPRVWQLRGNLSAYDAAYVALAEALDAPLLTGDRRVAAAPGHGATIELF